jgi:class 3 adenylate cyclase
VPEPTRYAKRPDGSLVAYRTAGDGPIDLVLSVGISCADVLWDHPASARFLDRLASFSRLIVFDFRGSGISDALNTPGLPTWEDWTDDLLVVLDEAGSERAALFVQASAAPSAIIFAATYPQRTSALALYLPGGMGQSPEVAEAVREIITDGWGTEAFCAVLAPSMADDHRYLSWVAKTQRLAASPRLAAALIYNLQTFDPTPFLPLVCVPTLVLDADTPIGASQGPQFAERIEGSRLVKLQSADTMLFGTAGSDEVADHVEEFLTGVRHVPVADRMLATVLFTDIVASTERAAKMGDRRWRELLDAHDAVIRERVEMFDGELVKTTGDGALATFGGPGRGVQCAKELRVALAELDIEIRAGLHTGEVELRADDVGGIAVHIGSRVASKANAGEILVSSTVKDLVVGSDLRFEERGVHALKGIPGDWRLFSVVG